MSDETQTASDPTQPSAADLDAVAAEQVAAEVTAESSPEQEAKAWLAHFEQTVEAHAVALLHLKGSSNATIKGTLVNQAIEKFEEVEKQLRHSLSIIKSKL